MKKELYNREYYEEDAGKNLLWGSSREIAISENILKHLKNPKQSNIIDIGCGDGFVLHQLKQVNKSSIYAFDLSIKRLENCNKHVQGLISVQGNALNLPFKDNSFDRVICSEAIEHIPGYEKVIKEIIRVIKKQAVITAPFDQEPVEIHCPKCKESFYLAGHINRVSIAKIEDLLKNYNAEVSFSFAGFHTIYSYNNLTLKFPRWLRLFIDQLLVKLFKFIPFLKPNYLLINIKKANNEK